MNACEKLLEYKPEWADDPVVIIGYFSDDDPGFLTHDWDQIFWHAGQLVDAYGKPVPATTKINLMLLDSTPNTLRECAEKNAPVTVEHLGYEAGKQKAISIALNRIRSVLEGLGG
jgi:hypothetical protein